MKEVIRIYNEEEKAFIHKYGECNLYSWECMSDSQKQEYQELENYYSIFAKLFSEHYEDLKLYALMYRNIPLYNSNNDALSVLFFASKQDEIIGFKKKLQADKKSDKAQIAFLYYANEALFPKACIKYANINFQHNRRICEILNTNTLNLLKTNNIPHVFSVNDLTDSECEQILLNKESLYSEYLNLYDKYLGDTSNIKLFNNSQNCSEYDFSSLRYIPILKEHSFVQRRIVRFLIKKIKMSYSKDMVKDEIEQLVNNVHLYITLPEKRIAELSKDLESSKNAKNETSTESIYGDYDWRRDDWIKKLEYAINTYEYAREKKQKTLSEMEFKYRIIFHCEDFLGRITLKDLENLKREIEEDALNHEQNKQKLQQLNNEISKENDYIHKRKEEKNRERNNKINSLEKEIEAIKNEVECNKAKIAKGVFCHESFKILYNNQTEANKFVNDSYEIMYNILWLRNPKKMQELESHTTNAMSIQNLFSIRYSSSIFKWFKSKKDNTISFRFNIMQLMTKWCAIINNEREEAQKLKREQELQIFREQEEKRKREEEVRREKFKYNQRNWHYRDANISFDKDKHIYTVNGKVLDSVTTLVNNAFPKFNPQEYAKYTAAKKGMTVQEVIDLWEMNGKKSRELGTLLHEKIEKHYQGVNSPDDSTFKLFKMFTKKIELKPYRTEWSVYDYELGIAGSIDFVDNQNGEYSIYDWKRSERLIVNGLPAKINPYGEKGNYPLEHLDNSPYYHYALQLSIYKYILEHNYNMKIVHLRLGIFHPSYMKPYLLEMPYLEDEVNTLFNLRSEIIF